MISVCRSHPPTYTPLCILTGSRVAQATSTTQTGQSHPLTCASRTVSAACLAAFSCAFTRVRRCSSASCCAFSSCSSCADPRVAAAHASDFRFQISNFRFRISDFGLQIADRSYDTPGARLQYRCRHSTGEAQHRGGRAPRAPPPPAARASAHPPSLPPSMPSRCPRYHHRHHRHHCAPRRGGSGASVSL